MDKFIEVDVKFQGTMALPSARGGCSREMVSILLNKLTEALVLEAKNQNAAVAGCQIHIVENK